MEKFWRLDWLVLGDCINQFKTGNLHAAVAVDSRPGNGEAGMAGTDDDGTISYVKHSVVSVE